MYSYPNAERPLETIASAGRKITRFCYKFIAKNKIETKTSISREYSEPVSLIRFSSMLQ